MATDGADGCVLDVMIRLDRAVTVAVGLANSMPLLATAVSTASISDAPKPSDDAVDDGDAMGASCCSSST